LIAAYFPVENRSIEAHIAIMKKPRVIIETVTTYRIVVEQDGRKYTAAIAETRKEAKKYAKEAEIDHGLRKPKGRAKEK
jgi:hypothetical protein